MNQQIKHIKSLSTNLQSCLNSINFRLRKKFCFLKSLKNIACFGRFWISMMQLVKHSMFEKFLVTDSHFDGVIWIAVFFEPAIYQWDLH